MEVSSQFRASDCFTPRKEPRTHLIEGWLGPRDGLDVLEKGVSFTCRHSNHKQSSPQSGHYTDYTDWTTNKQWKAICHSMENS
jgi:hypothetical protein